MWNLLHGVKDLRDNPSVTCGDSSAQGTPFGCPKGEPSNTSLQTPYQIKLTTYTSNTSKNQHCKYRQGQQPALASPRRTASVTSEFRRTVLTRQPQKLHFAGNAVRCGHSPLHKQQQSKKKPLLTQEWLFYVCSLAGLRTITSGGTVPFSHRARSRGTAECTQCP